MYLKIGCYRGFMPFIEEIVKEKGESKLYAGAKVGVYSTWYITINEFRKYYKEYTNWNDCRYTKLLVGEIDNDFKNKIKKIIQNQITLGYAKTDAILKIYGLINKDELPFDENAEDMKTAEILYDIVWNWI